jgi:hypothetical protein
MRKKKVKKLALARETLHDLAAPALHEAAGATHDFSHCNPTACATVCVTRCASNCFSCVDCDTVRTGPP